MSRSETQEKLSTSKKQSGCREGHPYSILKVICIYVICHLTTYRFHKKTNRVDDDVILGGH